MDGPESKSNQKQTILNEPVLFPIVGIGASAGGLEAFGLLVSSLEIDTGMAFVLVQHLAPEHDSILDEILGQKTAMPVLVVKEGARVEPNHIYIIPPNTYLSIDGFNLKLVPRVTAEDGFHPIDHFFRSLAFEHKENSIGVVLSGMGTDGTKGLAAINEAGGITFAQDIPSAKFDGMPVHSH